MIRSMFVLSILAIASTAFCQDARPPRNMPSSNAFPQAKPGKRIVIADFNILALRGHTSVGTLVLGLAEGSFDSCTNVQIHVRDIVSAEPGQLVVYKDGIKVKILKSTVHDSMAAFDIDVPVKENETLALQVTVDATETIYVDYGKVVAPRK